MQFPGGCARFAMTPGRVILAAGVGQAKSLTYARCASVAGSGRRGRGFVLRQKLR